LSTEGEESHASVMFVITGDTVVARIA
jgi:hypothetical protein